MKITFTEADKKIREDKELVRAMKNAGIVLTEPTYEKLKTNPPPKSVPIAPSYLSVRSTQKKKSLLS